MLDVFADHRRPSWTALVTEGALDLLQQAIVSPWLYGVLFALAALDGVIPMIPGETALVTAAVFAASADPSLAMIVLAGASGAFVGDHAAYLVGRLSFARITNAPDSRSRAAFDWARRQLEARGGQVLLSSRYVPGVRTATTLLLGGVRYPLRRFAMFDAAAALFWAGGWSIIGFVGGAAFRDRPLFGLLLGIGLAAAFTVVGELTRRWRRGRRSRESGTSSFITPDPRPDGSVGTRDSSPAEHPEACRTPGDGVR